MKLRKVMMFACLLLLAGVLAFGSGQSGRTASAGSYGTPGEFPLEKTLILRAGIWERAYDPNDNPLVKMWEEDTNVKLEWVMMESDEMRCSLIRSMTNMTRRARKPGISRMDWMTPIWEPSRPTTWTEKLSKRVRQDCRPMLEQTVRTRRNRYMGRLFRLISAAVTAGRAGSW